MECTNAMSGARHEVGSPWVNSISRSNVIAWLLCAYTYPVRQSPSEGGSVRRQEAYSRDGNHPLRVVWEGVKRAGWGVASPLCDTPTVRSDVGGRASYRVLCGYVYMYHDCIVWGMECELRNNRLEKSQNVTCGNSC